MNTAVVIVAILVIIVVIGGAYWYTSMPSSPTTTVTGSVSSMGQAQGKTVYTISDAAASGVSSVNLQVQSIEMQNAASGKWYTATSASGSGAYSLHGQATYTFIGNATVPAGTYDNVELNLNSVTATYANGTTANMTIPNDSIDVAGSYTIQSTANTTAQNWINFDIKSNESVHSTSSGALILLPVVEVVAWSGASLSAGQGNNVTVQNYGTVTADQNAGMNVSGTMQANFMVPLTANLTTIGNVVISLG